jgi:hypothetical protein
MESDRGIVGTAEHLDGFGCTFIGHGKSAFYEELLSRAKQ